MDKIKEKCRIILFFITQVVMRNPPQLIVKCLHCFHPQYKLLMWLIPVVVIKTKG